MKDDKKQKQTLSRIIAPLVSAKLYTDIVGEKPVYNNSYWNELGTNKHDNRKLNHKRVPENVKKIITDFWFSDEITRVAPNRTKVIKRKRSKKGVLIPNESIEVYYRQYTISVCYDKFVLKHDKIVSRGTFYKYKPSNVVKPKSKQDYCPICKEIHRLKKAGYFNEDSENTDLGIVHSAIFHENLIRERNTDYKNQLDNQKDDEVIAIIDFKANISLGLGPCQDSRIFFGSAQRTIFGIALYFKKDDHIYKINVSVITPILNHDTKTVKEILNKLLSNPLFDHFKTKSIRFWMDNAPNHFRVMETMATFYELETTFGYNIELNFFPEYHGKSECDRHFGLLSRLYTTYTYYGVNDDVNTTDAYIKIIKDGIRSKGGIIINQNGFQYDELLISDKNHPNALIFEFMYDDMNIDELAEKYIRNTNSNERKKGHFIHSFPYTKKVLVVKEKDFVLQNFYRFRFSKTNHGLNKLICNLSESTGEEYKYNFKINEIINAEYKLRIGIKTAAVPITKSLKNAISKHNFHFDKGYTPIYDSFNDGHPIITSESVSTQRASRRRNQSYLTPLLSNRRYNTRSTSKRS